MKKVNNPWTTILSRRIYKNPYIEVVEDKVIKPNGSKGIYGFVKTRKTVGIVPVDKYLNFYLCRQFRYIFKEESWEIPRGFVANSEKPVDAARRELKEEANLTTGELGLLGSLRLSIGLIDEEASVYLAKNVTFLLKKRPDEEKEIIAVKKFPLAEIISMIVRKKEIKDGLTIGAVLMAKQVIDEFPEGFNFV